MRDLHQRFKLMHLVGISTGRESRALGVQVEPAQQLELRVQDFYPMSVES